MLTILEYVNVDVFYHYMILNCQNTIIYNRSLFIDCPETPIYTSDVSTLGDTG